MSRIAGALFALFLVVVPIACSSAAADPGPPRGGSASQRLAFVDVGRQAGIDFRQGAFRFGTSPDAVAMTGGGLCWLDYDGDGWLDLFVVNGFAQADRGRWQARGGLPTTRLYRNEHGRFRDVTAETGAGFPVRGQGCVAADLDGDGRTDLFVTTAERSLLLWNEGKRFEEDAVESGVGAYGWLTGATAGDLNGDGRPELFVAGYADLNNRIPEATLGFPNTYLGVRDLLFLNEGGRHFREVGVDAGLEAARFAYGLGAVMTDVNGDGDLDLYVANDTNPNRLYDNVAWPGGAKADPGGLGFRFEERAASAGVADAYAGMGVAEGDFDGDTLPDLFVTNARQQAHGVFRSLPGGEEFSDVRDELGTKLSGSTGWGVTWTDLDLDGDLDLVIANGKIPVTDLAGDAEPMQVLVDEEGAFHRAPLPVRPLNARGSAVADYDNDGDPDVAVLSIGGRLVLLRNIGTGGNWLDVDLRGPVPGAVVTAVLADGRRLVRELHAGSSYLSSEDPRALFGLGGADRVRELIVRWPDGQKTIEKNVAANRIVKVKP